MDRFSRMHSNKRLLLAALLASSASGCVSQPGTRLLPPAPEIVASERPPFLNRDAGRPHALADAPPALVQPAGFNEGVVVASPVVFAEQPQTDASAGQALRLESSSTGEVVRRQAADEPKAGDASSQSKANEPTTLGDSDSDKERPESPKLPDSQVVAGQPVDYFVSVAVSRHPKILAARQRVAAATNVIPQAQALPDPNFNNIFWPITDNALQTAGGRVAHQMSISQAVPLPEKLRTKGDIASREVQIAQAEVDRIIREITESVRLAYYEVWFSTRAITIIDETKALVEDLTDVAEARYRSGGSQQDVLRAQLETDRLDEQLIALHKQKAVAQADLATLLQQPVELVPETVAELGHTNTSQQIDELLALAEQCNPSLRGLVWEIQRDREKQRLACLQRYPDFMVGMNLGIISENHNVLSPVANGHDNLSLSFGTTLPIWRDKINAGIREASHRTSSTARRLESERDELFGKIRRLLVQLDALTEQRDIYQARIIPRTEQTLELAIADYRGKRTDFFTLIETYRELLMFETQLARIDATLAGTVAQLDRTVGAP